MTLMPGQVMYFEPSGSTSGETLTVNSDWVGTTISPSMHHLEHWKTMIREEIAKTLKVDSKQLASEEARNIRCNAAILGDRKLLLCK